MRICLIIFIMSSSIFLGAQEDYKFKKVSKEMLNQSIHPLEEATDAAFLYNGYYGEFVYNESYGVFEYEYTVYHRIKIYKESGKDWGNFLIPLYKDGKDEEKTLDIDAITYNLEGGKRTEQKVSKSDIYQEEVNEYYEIVKFAMPNVQEGSILEVRYKVKSPFTFRVSEYYLQKSIPVDYALYEIGIPEYYGYSPLIKGLVSLESAVDSKSGSIRYTNIANPMSMTTRGKTTEQINYEINISKYFASDIPSLVHEDYLHNIDNYRSSIAHEKQFTKFPGSPYTRYSNTWDKVATLLSKHSDFGKELERLTKESDDILSIVTAEDDLGKATQIYEYISNNYTWDGKNRLFGSGAKDLLKEKKGNSADINLLLVGALRKAGLNANPIVSKTRNEGYLNVAFPVIADLNYVFVKLETEKGPIFLDATTKGLPFGYIPTRADNLSGVVITENKGEKIDIHNPNEIQKLEYIKVDLSDNSLKGTKTIKYSKLNDYYARNAVETMESLEEYIEEINTSNPEASVSNCEFKNKDNPEKDLVCDLEIDYSNYLKGIDGKIFIPVALDQGYKENPFRDEVRNFNIFFNSTKNYRSSIIVSLPENYSIESIPESKAFSLPERAATFSITFNEVAGGYAVNIKLSRNVTTMSAESYLDLRRFYDEIVKATNENIVVVKG